MDFYNNETFQNYQVVEFKDYGRGVEFSTDYKLKRCYVAWNDADTAAGVGPCNLAFRDMETGEITYCRDFSGYDKFYIRERLMNDDYVGFVFHSPTSTIEFRHQREKEAT